MTYVFGAPLRDQMAGFFVNLHGARDPSFYAERSFLHAMVCLVCIYDSAAREAPVDSALLAKFRSESAEALAPFAREVAAYFSETLHMAEEARDDEWYELCVRRSAIESLVVDYGDRPATALIDRGELPVLDEELRRVGLEQGPVPARYVPSVPASHWWWRYPEGPAS